MDAVCIATDPLPDVVLMDIPMPVLDGTAATRAMIAAGLPRSTYVDRPARRAPPRLAALTARDVEALGLVARGLFDAKLRLTSRVRAACSPTRPVW